jgi:hypothetical protein
MSALSVWYLLAALIGIGIIFIGARFLVAPSIAATGYGVTPGKGGYLSAKGVRDIVSGLFVFVLIANGAPHMLGAIMATAALIPIGDALIVLRNHGSRLTVFGIHGATAAFMLAVAALLLSSPA